MKHYSYVAPKSPPSSYAVAGVLEGEPGAWGRVAIGTLQRSLFLVPGLYLADLRGRQLATAVLFGSASITAALFVLYASRR